jgi:NADPH:quinone reductase-like Zn-dependent oxidoreductase
MKAVRFHEYGDADVLRLEDVPDPEPGPGEVVVRVRAVGLNHVDVDMRNGTSRLPLSLPHTLGFEAGGDVAAVGEGVTDLAEGDRVTPLYQVACRRCVPCLAGRQQFCERLQMLGVQRPGAYAEYVLAPADAVVPLPDATTYEQAASTQTTFATAWHCLVTRARVRAGETVLVSAAGSGVGSSGIQVARRAGARVITTAGSDEKLERARELGADVGINYATEDLAARVREATDGRGVDVVLEHVGGRVFEQSLTAVADGGRVVVCGGHAGEVVDLDLIELFRHEWSVIGCARASEAELRHVIELVGRGELTPVVSEALDLADAAGAHRLMEDRRQFGKLVLIP